MSRKTPPPCAYCHGYGLDAGLWGLGYRRTVAKEIASLTERVNCDRCGKGGTPGGEATAERSRQRMIAAQSKR